MCEGGKSTSGSVGIVNGRGEGSKTGRPHQCSSCSRCSCGRIAEVFCTSRDCSVHGGGLADWSVDRSGGKARRRSALAGILCTASLRRKPLLLDLLPLALVSSVLEPDFDLGFCQAKKSSQLFSLVSSEVFLDCKSPLQLENLSMRK